MKKSKRQLLPKKETIYKLYKFLVKFETEVAKNRGEYNYEDPKISKFCEVNNIILKPVSKPEYVNDLSGNSYITFKKESGKKNDIAHDLLRHIRNAVAHALINKTSSRKKTLNLTDVNKNGKKTMRGNISEGLLFDLIDILLDSRTTKI